MDAVWGIWSFSAGHLPDIALTDAIGKISVVFGFVHPCIRYAGMFRIFGQQSATDVLMPDGFAIPKPIPIRCALAKTKETSVRTPRCGNHANRVNTYAAIRTCVYGHTAQCA